MKALVTGATGFVGYSVVKTLLADNIPVKVMVRNTNLSKHLAEMDVEVCQGDLLDVDSLNNALKGCDYLFHVAAHYKLWEKDTSIFYKINVEGSRNILKIAGDLNYKKIVYTSSVATIKPLSDKTPANEETITNLEDIVGDYKKSKFLAEIEAKKLAAEGLPIVIVNPSAPIGPFDIKPTPTGQIILDYLRKKMVAYLDTGLNLVAVEDVAKGHILAADKGKYGERYILGNQNLKLIEIFKILEKITGIKAPSTQMPYMIAYTAGIFSGIFARMFNTTPAVPLDGVRMAKKYMFFDSSKAIKELGYNPTSVESALERAVEWFKKNFKC